MSPKRLTVLTVVGTRPEIIRLSRVIAELDAETRHILVHTGQNYSAELSDNFFRDLGIRAPDYALEAAGDTPTKTVGQILTKIEDILEKEKPDAFLVLGDTNSCLAAYAAKRRKIPIFHMEAGNRCFDERVPEEVNRKIIDHLADLNLVYSDLARQNLIQEGLRLHRIFKTGSPLFEVLSFYRAQIHASSVLAQLNIEADNYFLFSIHREENVDSERNFGRFLEVLNTLATEYHLPIIVSTHPRTRKRLDQSTQAFASEIRFLPPLGFFDYNKLQLHARCVLSDSGTISEESSILNFRALNLREAHERPEAMDEATVMMTGMNPERIFQGLEILKSQPTGTERILSPVAEYHYPNVSKKVLRMIVSYIDQIKAGIHLS